MDSKLRLLEREAATGDPSAVARLERERARLRPARPMFRLSDYMVRQPQGGESHYWGHIQALETFAPSLEVIESASDNDYQGNDYALLRVADTGAVAIWRDSFGSCEGCDSLLGSSAPDAWDYVRATLAEGNTRQFWTVAEAAEYLRATDDYFWAESWGGGLREFREAVCKLAGIPSDRHDEED